jgi:hypothetical protein
MFEFEAAARTTGSGGGARRGHSGLASVVVAVDVRIRVC